MPDYYQIITGTIKELEVFDTQEHFFRSCKLAGLPSIGLLALGDSAAAASQLSSADSNEEGMAYLNSVQYFRCKLGHVIVEGLFCRVFFADGDDVEIVAELRKEGSYFAYALRRPIDHRLWLHPWATRGTKVGNKSALKFSIIFNCCCLIFTMIIAATQGIDLFLLFLLLLGIIVHFFLGIIVYFLHKSIFSGGSQVADKIFATLGYPNPQYFNMELETYLFCKHLEENESDFYVDITTKQYQQESPEGTKWVTFYREAPPIPDYIKVIHTGSSD